MNRLLILFFLSFSLKSWSQYDAFKFNFDLTCGFVNYTYTDIKNDEFTYSTSTWDGIVHSHSYSHLNYKYSGVNALFHAGLHIPVYKREIISFGLRPKVGIGRLIQYSPKPSVNASEYSKIPEDPKRISATTVDAELYAYMRFNFLTKKDKELHTIILFGYRMLRSNDNYYTPVFAFEYGQKYWSIGLYAHLTQMNYYREFSDGSKEVAKKFYEWGLKTNLFLGVKSKKQKV